MKKWKISIIVPVYNVENYLEESISSLVNQTYDNLEILLVNDGSKDGSGRICDELAEHDNRIRVIHKENGGVVSAWTTGAREATGDYLNFMDSDDWVDLEMIEEMAAHLTGKQREIVACDYVIEKGEGKRQFVYQRLAPGAYTRADLQEDVFPKLLGEEERFVFFSRCMKLYSRQLVTENLCFCDKRVRMGDDSLITIPALLDCERLVVMDRKAYYHYRYVENSIVHGYDKNMFQNLQWFKTALDEIVTAKYPAGEQEYVQKRAWMEYLQMMLLVLKNEARGNPSGYRKNIADICRTKEMRRLVKSTPIEVGQMSNKLLYGVLKHPNVFMITLLRAAMIWYYRG